MDQRCSSKELLLLHLYTNNNTYDPKAKLKDCNYLTVSSTIAPDNGFCNDESNTIECAWDGGDCCGDNVDMSRCDFCECLEPWSYKLLANGECNDETNIEERNWDGGDCCGDGLYGKVKIVDHLGDPTCSSCECLEPSSRWNDNNCEEFRTFICEKEGTG